MKSISFNNYLFRCSSLGGLMTYPKKDTLSAGPKGILATIFKEELFQKSSTIRSKYLDKGLIVENEAIDMYNKFVGKQYKKNTKRYDNDYITGEPDIIDNELIDIKSSWDYSTFPLTETELPNKDYYWQMQGYMGLTGAEVSKVIYCLVDTPDEIIFHEMKVVERKLGVMELPEGIEHEIWDSHKYGEIPEKLRIKEFVVERNDGDIEKLYHRVEICREYLNSLTQILI